MIEITEESLKEMLLEAFKGGQFWAETYQGWYTPNHNDHFEVSTEVVNEIFKNNLNSLNYNNIISNDDKIIWDSGFGYELGYFKNNNSKCKIHITTGIVQGELSVDRSEVYAYNSTTIKLMQEKYNSKKDF